MEPEILDHVDNDKEETERKSTNGVVASSSSAACLDLERPDTGAAGQIAGNVHHDHDHEQQPRRTENSDDHHHVIIDVYESGEEEEEKICRICHLSGEASTGQTGLMELGCHCKAGLSICHPRCAETWFKHKGNSVCEVCGVRAKNVKLVMKNCNNSRMFIVDYGDIRPITGVVGQEGSAGCCKQSCCNFLLACLVMGLVLPWFFKTHLF